MDFCVRFLSFPSHQSRVLAFSVISPASPLLNGPEEGDYLMRMGYSGSTIASYPLLKNRRLFFDALKLRS